MELYILFSIIFSVCVTYILDKRGTNHYSELFKPLYLDILHSPKFTKFGTVLVLIFYFIGHIFILPMTIVWKISQTIHKLIFTDKS